MADNIARWNAMTAAEKHAWCKRECDAFDGLPPQVKAFISGSPIALSAEEARDFVARYGIDETLKAWLTT